MERLISELNPTAKIVYDKGQFDNWCVYIVENDRKWAPTDIECFKKIKELANKYSSAQLYKLFLIVYRHTHSSIDKKVIQIIENIADSFWPDDKITIHKWFVVIYAAMVAENKKENTKLGKRIKHLGIYQLLIDNYSPEKAANFSKGKAWKELDELMVLKGI